MKKKRKKWPFLVILFLSLCGGAFAGHQSLHKKKVVELQKLTSTSHTWSGFTEYKRLQMLLEGFAIKSVIDVPCCDLEIFLKQDFGIQTYIGVTENRERARALQAQFGSQVRSFLDREITIDVLPKADLILCWNTLCYLTTDQARAALLQFKKSGAKFILMHQYTQVEENQENTTGAFQPVNWKLSPFHFPEPIIQITEKGKVSTEVLALWNL